MALPHRVRLSDIVDRVDIDPAQAAAIVAQVAARLQRWIAARQPSKLIVPALDDLAIERGGRLWWRRGQCLPPENGVRALGHLLAALLSRAPEGGASPGLLYVVSRSTDPRHLAPLVRTDEFLTAVLRHAPSEPLHALDALVARFLAQSAGVPPLDGRSSIADVRRWRRASGVSLRTIAADTGIPASLLRELEWGVYANWRVPHAEGSISAYAERAGMDPALLIQIIARDQADSSLVPMPVAKAPDAVDRRYDVLPYACAVTLFLLLAFLPPGDTVERAGNAAPVVAAAPAVNAIVSAPPEAQRLRRRPTGPSVEPVRAANLSTDRRERPARIVAAPGERQDGGASPPRPADAAGAPSNPLAGMARAIAGSGKHRVEPFPRPADRQP